MFFCSINKISFVIIIAFEQSYNPEAYVELMEFVAKHPLDDGDKFCASMFRESSRHKNLGKYRYQASQSLTK
jgi:hypothetical protein